MIFDLRKCFGFFHAGHGRKADEKPRANALSK
jgi:hypothetical protein